ncbi:MAG: hypothetical protein IPF99_17835 [Deltaproteobacteria bacterium]|nr:hypothetical protein [Deltaproteobacteria bacterium]
MNPRALLGLGRHAPLLLLLSLSLGACATGQSGSEGEGEGDDAAVETDTPTTPEKDTPTFDLVSPLDDVGELDTGSPELDAGTPDTGSPELDAGAPDTGNPELDAGAPDTGSPMPDTGTPDTGTPDAGRVDVGVADAGPRDAGATDAGACTGGQARCGAACVDLQTDEANCGRCGTACSAGGVCMAGRCSTVACMVSASDCNMNSADGCELIHGASLNTCSLGDNMGAFCGDRSGGFLCAESRSLRVVATRTGNRSRWYRGRLNECSTICPSSLNGRLTLRVPTGVDYDLFVYSACGRLIGSSQQLAGITDQYTLEGGGDLGSDSFDFYVEVRWFSGASCLPYTLTFEARPS